MPSIVVFLVEKGQQNDLCSSSRFHCHRALSLDSKVAQAYGSLVLPTIFSVKLAFLRKKRKLFTQLHVIKTENLDQSIPF